MAVMVEEQQRMARRIEELTQREWVGLTKEEYEAIRYGSNENGDPNVGYELFEDGEYGMEINIYVDDFYRSIEAKLKEKNA
jgi:hypothetical protein